jgi:hypothetical protein
MTGIIQQYSVTVGNNTNVTATTQDLTAEQQKELAELQKKAPGDISISADGVISIASLKGLSLFNSFCVDNGIQDSSTNSLIKIDAPTNLPRNLLAGLKNASAFCAMSKDPSKMSLSDIMKEVAMIMCEVDGEKNRILAEVRNTQLGVAAKMGKEAYEAKREAAEKTYTMEVFQAVGSIVSGVVSAALTAGSAVYSAKGGLHQKQAQLNTNNQKLENNQLLQDQAKLKAELNLPDTQGATIEAKKVEIRQEIATKSQQMQANQEKIEVNNSFIEENNKSIATKQQAIDAKQAEIDTKQQEIEAAGGDPEKQSRLSHEKSKLEGEKTELESEQTDLEAQNHGLKAGNTVIEGENAKLGSELEGLKTQGGKLEQLPRVNEAIEKKGITPKKDSLSDGEVKGLEAENKQLEAEIKNIETKSNTLTSFSGPVQSVIKGVVDLYAAGLKKEAAFLDAEAQLLETFRSTILNNVQGLDASMNAANQDAQKNISALKQTLDEAYNILTSIARNI